MVPRRLQRARQPLRRRRRKKGGADEPEDHALGRSRGGFGTKIHLVSDANGLPLAAVLSAGQRHELPFAVAALEAVRLPGRRGRPRTRPRQLAGDKGYSAPWFRRYPRQAGVSELLLTQGQKAEAVRRFAETIGSYDPNSAKLAA
ncbi:transposase [Azospirillum brasilense]|nr:transposase [Azospirillum brasilense]